MRLCGELKPVATSVSMREGDWNALMGEKTSEMNELTALRTNRNPGSYGEYVKRVAALWSKFARSPNQLRAKDLSFLWQLDSSRTLKVTCLAHEFLLTCFLWVHEDLVQPKKKSRADFIRDLIKGTRLVRWHMLPVAKLLHLTDVPLPLTETGGRPLGGEAWPQGACASEPGACP